VASLTKAATEAVRARVTARPLPLKPVAVAGAKCHGQENAESHHRQGQRPVAVAVAAAGPMGGNAMPVAIGALCLARRPA
jgi:hypothetical protein